MKTESIFEILEFKGHLEKRISVTKDPHLK